MCDADLKHCQERARELEAEIAERDSTIARLRKALTPSASTKAAYIGEFSFSIPDEDENGEECERIVEVPWTIIKEIMVAIRAEALKKSSVLEAD